jgi:hypothetical protein
VQVHLTPVLGPVAENVRNQANKTTNDFNNLASARRTPDAQTANGQPLTRMFTRSGAS